MILRGRGGGGRSLCRVRIFISNVLRGTMDAGLFFYLPRGPGQNIYFKVFDGQDIYFKNLPPPPNHPYAPQQKKGTSFNHSQIVPTAILNT